MPNEVQKNINNTSGNAQDTRSGKYTEANDRASEMTDLESCMKRLEEKGYATQYRVEKKRLVSLKDNKKYKADDVVAANYFRFEGITNPDDMSILYAIETSDGNKGTLVDAYGLYADDDTGEFMKEVEIHKKVTEGKLD
jgi:hypothetical protein